MRSDEISASKRKHLRRYAAEVFSETLATGVPNIVNTDNWPRKIFKLCILLLCITGFLYQSIEFLTLVYSYPSVVDISVHTPKEYPLPAIDVCNNNGIVRTKFCHKYPERCETPQNKTEFCDENPHYSQYCKDATAWKNFKVPKADFYGYGENASLTDMKELTHDSKILFRKTLFLFEEEIDVKGPLIFFKNPTQYISCYGMHFRADSSEDQIKIQTHPMRSIVPAIKLVIDFELNETFLSGRKPEGILAIHSPFEFVNPFELGIRIKPKKLYSVHIKMTEEELLPGPYESDCQNYTQKWLDAGRKGPRSQEMCKRTCLFNLLMKYCNCSVKELAYPYEDDTCFSDSGHCLNEEAATEMMSCLELCKNDCEKQKFTYTADERLLEESDWESEEDKEKHRTYVSIYLSDPEVVVYRYRPRYETVEVFSYIGGYIGVWLGISLVAVVDFFECLLLIATFALRRRK